jgi:hypothetical protein
MRWQNFPFRIGRGSRGVIHAAQFLLLKLHAGQARAATACGRQLADTEQQSPPLLHYNPDAEPTCRDCLRCLGVPDDILRQLDRSQ